ncbi:MAG TPA: alpha/beta hydrolase [Prolixibacteraceae bacterium]|nr:alpha/beta hydrolase [Prolixibacteraceae bacterium]
MKHLIFILKVILPFFFFSLTITAQERYKDEITDSVRVETFTYAFKDSQSLDMDVYFPAFDNQSNRALIFYVHGGGFSGGERNEPGIQVFCKQLARHGYVVSSISYRLTRKGTETGFGCDCAAVDKLNTFNDAVEDLQDATFFMIQNRDKMGIDPQKIIISGSSAGAETVLNAAYQPPYCYGLDSGPVSYAGVISMAGAIPDTSRIFKESAIPSLLFHGTCDNLVPYATAPHHYCEENQAGYLILYGSYTIAEKLRKLGTPYWLYTYCNAAHEIAGKPMTDNLNEIIDFCYSFIIKKGTEQKTTIMKAGNKNCEYQSFNFCTE